jgi:hypothetical protein
MQYQITKAAGFLYDLGVRFYESGTISKGKEKLFDYYKADSITPDQKAAILQWCPDANFKIAQSQYAPEIIKPIVCFPKAAFYRMESKCHI